MSYETRAIDNGPGHYYEEEASDITSSETDKDEVYEGDLSDSNHEPESDANYQEEYGYGLNSSEKGVDEDDEEEEAQRDDKRANKGKKPTQPKQGKKASSAKNSGISSSSEKTHTKTTHNHADSSEPSSKKDAKNRDQTFSPTGATRRSGNKSSPASSHAEESNRRQSKTDYVSKNSSKPTGLFSSPGALFAFVGVALAIVLAGVYMRNSTTDMRCQSAYHRPTAALASELLSVGNLSPAFDASAFVSAFQHRKVGRPTVVHLVSKSQRLPHLVVDALRRFQPCTGKLALDAHAGDFRQRSSDFALSYEHSSVDLDHCRAILAVTLQNGAWAEQNRAWLEPALDDSNPFLPTDKGQASTEAWCVLFLDHWTGDRAAKIDEWTKNSTPRQLEEKMRQITIPLWTDRFYNRILHTFYV